MRSGPCTNVPWAGAFETPSVRTKLIALFQHNLSSADEGLEAVEPDVHLVADLIALSSVIPDQTKATARSVVDKVVAKLMKKLEEPLGSAITGAVNRQSARRRPRLAEIAWNRTIRANLQHYQPIYRTIIPEQLNG